MKTRKHELKNEIKTLKNAIAAKCLDCVCCQPKEIIRCQITGCPLWDKRPKELTGVYLLMKVLKEKNPGFFEAEKQ